jgi:hypothetical protein
MRADRRQPYGRLPGNADQARLMSTKKKAAKLKPAHKLNEAEWLQELTHIENEVTHVVDIFNFLEEVTRLGNESEAAFDAFNATPLFWNVHRDCLQESMFMGLGRLSDPSSDAINVNRVLSTAMIHPEFFSEQALRGRLKERNLGNEHADNILADAWVPNGSADFKYLKKAVSFHLGHIEQIYRPIRNSHYGHRLTQSDIQAMFARTNRKDLGKTLDALHELVGGLLSLHQNGLKPEIGARNLEPYNDNIKGYARSVVRKVAGREL